MENKKIYAIMNSYYSDWNIHGYMEDKDKAEKYCAFKNQTADEFNQLYVIDLNEINADVSKVVLKYYHSVCFDFPNGMRDEDDRYKYYVGEDIPSDTRYNLFKDNTGWINFSFNCETRKKAEKIAQDKYAQFMSYYSENQNYDMSARLIGAISFNDY